jgi:malyl-CoA/(S)-citramalyl-CoA lyase
LVACRAFGLRPVDGPFGDFKDPEGYILSAKRAAALGYEGKWSIHPSQIELANSVFSPTEAEVELAKLILTALEEATAAGKGAASFDGRLIDTASARMAKNVVKQNELIQSKSE